MKTRQLKLFILLIFIQKIKSHDISIDLSNILREKGIKHEIHFIGDGLLINHYKEQVNKLKLEKFIFFHGFLNKKSFQ